MINTLASRKKLEAVSAIIGGLPDDKELLRELVRFGVAGFDAMGGASSPSPSLSSNP
jgi:hypothetical protein